VLGSEHRSTLVSISNFALLLQAMGRLAEAEALAHEALATSRRVLGDEHPDTRTFSHNVAQLQRGHGHIDP
jgi:hypothetical protein